jgi:hypothetical protein
MANDHGSAPATRETPAIPAPENEPTRFSPAAYGAMEDDDAARIEIEAAFKARLKALRRLPRYQRPLALRAAREWRMSAIAELREKRMRERAARSMLWRQQQPPPSQPN